MISLSSLLMKFVSVFVSVVCLSFEFWCVFCFGFFSRFGFEVSYFCSSIDVSLVSCTAVVVTRTNTSRSASTRNPNEMCCGCVVCVCVRLCLCLCVFVLMFFVGVFPDFANTLFFSYTRTNNTHSHSFGSPVRPMCVRVPVFERSVVCCHSVFVRRSCYCFE